MKQNKKANLSNVTVVIILAIILILIAIIAFGNQIKNFKEVLGL